MATPRFLHVANGTSTTLTIGEAGIPGRTSIWADVLYEGPVPGGLSDAELREVRAQFLAPEGEEEIDPVLDLRRWRAVIEDHQSYDELILWFEHDLFDQLNLVQLLSFIHGRVPPEKVSLICIGSFPGRPHFKGLGELMPRELAPLLDIRQRVTGPQYALAERAWEAFRAPTPEPLDQLRHADTAALPYLAPAIARFLQEYPWTVDGLSRSERRLLELAGAEPITLSAAFPRMQDGENAYYIMDGSLAWLADVLSESSPPLLARAPGPNVGYPLLRTTVNLTDTGRAVLGRQQDRIATCGIDRWLGGVHLQGTSNVWRWDDARQTVVR